MRTLLARVMAVLLTVVPSMAAWLSAPKPEKTEVALSSPYQSDAPHLTSVTPNLNPSPSLRDLDIPPAFAALSAGFEQHAAPALRASAPLTPEKLFLAYSSLKLDGG